MNKKFTEGDRDEFEKGLLEVLQPFISKPNTEVVRSKIAEVIRIYSDKWVSKFDVEQNEAIRMLCPGNVPPKIMTMKKCRRCSELILVSEEGFSFETPNVEKKLKEELKAVCLKCVTDLEWKIIAKSKE